MKETIRHTKWYWWIPLVGLYFIEEMAGWVYDAKIKPIQAKRLGMTYRILLLHVISLIIFGYIINK
jgi:hypothetical protein